MESRKRASSQRATGSKTKTLDSKQEDEPLRVVLKLPVSSKRLKSSSVFGECLQLETPEYVLETLLMINDAMYPQLVENWDKGMAQLKKLWNKYSDNLSIGSVLLRLLSRLLPLATSSLSRDTQTFLLSLLNNKNDNLRALVFKCWMALGSQAPPEFVTSCLEKAWETVYHPSYAVRAECLNLIGRFGHITSSHDALLKLVMEFCTDSDGRVRRAAVEALLTMNKDHPLGLEVYDKVCMLLSDDDDSVRITALKLVHSVGLNFADSHLPLPQDASITLRIEDDAFIKICNMISDSSVRVRSLAARLLGQFPRVSDKFLEQTLDKKLMSHLRVVKSEHERARELHQGGGGVMDWDTGQRWGGRVPRPVLDPSEVVLMSAGACGAFVHSLEDEYMEVRAAAVESMGHLCAQSRGFATLSLDFLVDMFNDEIEGVRLSAINCLRQVSSRIELREDQLETILGVLEESSQEIREAIHDLLATCRLTSVAGLQSTVSALLGNLRKYPHDRQSVWECLRQLGASHAYLVATVTPQLLSTHPYFLSKEPDIDDPSYVSVLILVFNAAGSCPIIPPLFPSHVLRHYAYLKDTIPSLIPILKLGPPAVIKGSLRTAATANSFLQRLLARAQSVSSTGNVGMATLQQCISDLGRLGKLEPLQGACASYAASLLQCQLLLCKIRQALCSSSVIISSGPSSVASEIRQQLLLLSYQLQWGYQGLSSAMELDLFQLRLVAHSGLLLLALHLDLHSQKSDLFHRVKQAFHNRLESLERYCHAHQLTIPASLQPLISGVQTLTVDHLVPVLAPLLTSTSVLSQLSPAHLAEVRQCRVEMHQPEPSSKDSQHKFLSSLALSLSISASITNLTEPSACLAVQVLFPDGRQLLFPPQVSEIKLVEPNSCKLNTLLIISHGTWTDSSVVEVCLVRRFTPDVAEEQDCLALLLAAQKRGGGAVCALGPKREVVDAGEGVMVISERVRVNIHPQDTLSKGFNVFGTT